jgi:hypothetical protein
MKNYIYIHVCCIHHWREILADFLCKIKESGLYEKVSEIRCGLLGQESDADEDVFLDPKIRILFVSGDIRAFEFPTINKIHEDAQTEDFNVLYLHTKGVTRGDNTCVKDWVNYMCYFNIYRHETCLELLEEHDSVGVNLQVSHTGHVYPLHYSGNFWWSKSAFLRRLNRCEYKEYNSSEFWLTERQLGSHVSLWNSGKSHYGENYGEEEYKDKDFPPHFPMII